MSSCDVSVVSMSSCLHLFEITVFCGSIKGEHLFLETSAFRGLGLKILLSDVTSCYLYPKGTICNWTDRGVYFCLGLHHFDCWLPLDVSWYMSEIFCCFSIDQRILKHWTHAEMHVPSNFRMPQKACISFPFSIQNSLSFNIMEAIELPKTIIFSVHFPLSSIPPVFFFPILSEVPLVTATRRPALAPSVVTFSVPDLTYPPIKARASLGMGMWGFQQIAPTCRDLWVFWWVRVVETN